MVLEQFQYLGLPHGRFLLVRGQIKEVDLLDYPGLSGLYFFD
jgi:hypothetical protein